MSEVVPKMPTYEYRCAKCDEHLEVYQSFSEEPLKRHAGCGGKLAKVFGSVGIVLKGSGFYRTDNRAPSRTKAETTSSSETKTETKTKTETAKTPEKKTETAKTPEKKTA